MSRSACHDCISKLLKNTNGVINVKNIEETCNYGSQIRNEALKAKSDRIIYYLLARR